MTKVLIADDEDEIRELVKYAFKGQDIKILESSTGADTLECIKNEKPDLIILDIMLPGIDGYSVQLQVAQSDEMREIPVIVLTALQPAQSLFEKFAQVKEYIVKPFDPQSLVKLVTKILSESKK